MTLTRISSINTMFLADIDCSLLKRSCVRVSTSDYVYMLLESACKHMGCLRERCRGGGANVKVFQSIKKKKNGWHFNIGWTIPLTFHLLIFLCCLYFYCTLIIHMVKVPVAALLHWTMFFSQSHFFGGVIRSKTKGRVMLSSLIWRKQSLDNTRKKK